MMFDYSKNALEEKTLRELIIMIRNGDSNIPENLYHAVGQDWKGHFPFMCLQSKEAKARMIVDDIIPYFEHFHVNDVLSYLYQEAVMGKHRPLLLDATILSVLGDNLPKVTKFLV